MYETLIAKIKTTLESVAGVKEVFSEPKTPTKYPAVYFCPAGFTNTFETQSENMKVYRFSMDVIIGCEQTTIANVYSSVLPKTVDAIVAAFDAAWNGGTIEGHRVTVKIDSADEWKVGEAAKGVEVYAPMNIEVRLLTTN